MRLALGLVLFLLAALPVNAARLEARIDISDQQMTVTLDNRVIGVWPVSTARAGKFTPVGLYYVQSMKRMHYSTLYHNAPMPWSIFFSGNFAIHGTNQISRLGTPASAGCVRLHPDDAETLYRTILDVGRRETVIHITR